MKKLIIAANGHPRTNNDLLHLQDAILEISTAVSRIGNPIGDVVVSGLEQISFTSFFAFNQGYIYSNGELFYVPAIAPIANLAFVNGVFRVVSAFAANNPYLGKNIHNIRTMVFVDAANVGSPQNGDINCDILFSPRLANKIVSAGLIKGRYYNVVPSSSASLLVPKMISGYNTAVNYWQDQFGRIQFAGAVNEIQDEFSSGGAAVITLPAGFRTSRMLRFVLPAYHNGVVVSNIVALISPSGPFAHSIFIEAGYSSLHSGTNIDLSAITYLADV